MRVRSIVVLALVGLLSSVALAMAPVQQETFRYSYRPIGSSVDVDGVAVASLGIVRAVPDALYLSLPCDVPGSGFRTLNIDNWRVPEEVVNPIPEPVGFPDLGDGLVVDIDDKHVSVRLGSREIISAPVTHSPGCLAELDYEGEVWSLTVGDDSWSTEAPGPTFAEAAFSGLASSSPAARVNVETRELGTSPSSVQLFLWLLMIIFVGLAARGIVVRYGSGRSPTAWRVCLRHLAKAVGLVDVVVVASMIGLILLIPPSYDDGWLRAISGGFGSVGDFSTVYENQGTLIPLGYWFYWVQHLWVDVSTSVFVLRLPMLVLGVITWVGLRAMWASAATNLRLSGRWVMAAVYIVGFGAWGTMLRPEPVVAALLVASVALARRFRQGQRGWVVMAWVAVLALAVTAHTSGVIVVAPVVVSWRFIWEWLRVSRGEAWIVASTGALLATAIVALLVIDSNLATEVDWARSFRALEAHSLSPWDELLRYEFLDGLAMSSMRRVSVALIGVAVAGHILVVHRREDLATLTGWSVFIALGLLALTPSKWPLHFGGFYALAALGVAFASQMRDKWRVAVQSLTIAWLMAWAWRTAWSWNALDLRTQQWWPGATNLFPLDLSSWLVWLGVAGVFGGLGVAVDHAAPERRRMSVHGGLVMFGALVVLFLTAATFMIDAVRTDGWVFASQNINSLAGEESCGLGDEIVLPAPGSLRSLVSVSGFSVMADVTAADAGFLDESSFASGAFPALGINQIRPLAGLAEVGSWVEQPGAAPEATVGTYRSDWYAVDGEAVALMVMGAFGMEGSESNAVALQWGEAVDGTIVDLGLDYAQLAGYFVDWKLVLLDVPPGADLVRVMLRDHSTGGDASWVAASAPLGIEVMSLGDIAALSVPGIVVTPQLALYMPCIPKTELDGPVVDAPTLLILTRKVNAPALVWHTTFLRPATSDRYFVLDLDVSNRQGDLVPVLLSQQYLTGEPARVNGRFVRWP